MVQRLFHYCASLTFLVAFSVIYQNLIVPWMQPPMMNAIGIPPESESKATNNFQDLFPEGAWQHGVCKQLQTSTGTLLFQKWEQISDDQWKLWPVTVIIGRGMSASENSSPVIIEADSGAEIQFTQSLDVMSGGAPPISRGRILGDVHIFRNDAGNPARRFDLRTANVGIDNKKIWTTESIEMRVGRARWVGRDLTLHLAAPTSSPGRRGADILDRLELIYLDAFTMPLGDGGLWQPDGQTPGNQRATDPKQRAAMVSLQCGGRVEYDFALDQLMLSDSVSLIHQVQGLLADRFDCDWLQLTLNDPTNAQIDRADPLDWLVGIVASGSPAVAKLPSFDSELAAEQIDFNAVNGVIRASGRQGILVRRGGIKARLARLIYQFDPENPESVLGIDAPGAGLVEINDPEIPVRKAHWQNGFRVSPQDSAITRSLNTEVRLDVEGDVQAQLTDGGSFRADRILGYLKPEPGSGPDEENTMVPDRFEIAGNVRVDTTAIAAETQRLLLYFVAEPDPAGRSVGGESSTSSLRQWVAQPSADGQFTDPVARPRPSIRGDLVSAKLRRNQSGLSAKQLTVTGNVEVTHQIKMGDQSLPAKLNGDNLQLIDGGGEDVLQLGSGTNSPARFEIGDGFFVGPQIQIRPNDNIIWINAAGEFQIPTSVLPSEMQGDNKLQWVKPPHCRWLGEMIFDGRTAILTDGVELTAQLIQDREQWDLQMTGDRLQVDLMANVQVRDVQTMKSAQIQQVALLGGSERPVYVQAFRHAGDGLLEAKHLLHAERLVMTPTGGMTLSGVGPGWYRSWQRGIADNSFLQDGDKSPASGSSQSDELTGIHLTFNDRMEADLTLRSLEFLRGVRVGVKAVSDWDQTFDARQMDAISMGESTLDCDRLRFAIDPSYSNRTYSGGKTPWEMEALQGVVFRTRNERGLLEGTANRASYASIKDLFTIDGAPNRAAIFRQILPDGSPGLEGAVRTMSVRPKTMKIEAAVFERLASPPPDQLRQ
ncbi:MAG: hypothetical protein AAGG48_24345 [Planctomycetota bacterium]